MIPHRVRDFPRMLAPYLVASVTNAWGEANDVVYREMN